MDRYAVDRLCPAPIHFFLSCWKLSNGELNDAVPMRAEMDGMIFEYDTVIDGVFFKDDILVHYPASKMEAPTKFLRER